MPKKPTASQRKQPTQSRSRQMVKTIVDSAARVLIDEGYESFNTNRVAEVAGISIGSLYQYFPNKKALIEELSKQHLLQIGESINKDTIKLKHLPLEDIVRRLVRSHIQLHKVEPELHRILSNHVPETSAQSWKNELLIDIREKLFQLLSQHAQTRHIKNLSLALFIVMETVEAVVHAAVFEQTDELINGAVEEQLTRLIVGYLTSS
ncbi:MAG: hypothetical protein COA96_14345 [SAR86 cluster bacterium]|uniref:HTH tetR-type domain-containing protein n=1 Tax=SAR86 cluster bacterium TaxID=2030880 RepID=A0A2A5AT35_9GAMM|nr:MAG: hypothetical protein COA96_14345 [SAR86 cluster bacterium]